jgi:phosphoesterase RecJ-like protein
LKKENFQSLADFLKQEKRKVVVLSHTHPDGDSIGSSLALKTFLEKLGHEVSVIFPDDIPAFYLWMPRIQESIIAKRNFQEAIAKINESQVVFFMDMNAVDRTDVLSDYLKSIEGKNFVLIDHHIDPEPIFDISLSTIYISSTSELLLEFILYYDETLLDYDMAVSLYTGIITDTGRFAYGNFTDLTLERVARLLRFGIKPMEINELIYNTYSQDRLKLFGYALHQKLQILPEYKASYIALSRDELKQYNYQKGDTEGLVNYGLKLNDIGITALFVEFEKYIKISFRSKEKYDVNYLASTYFHGGGHRNASGSNFYGTLEEGIELYKKALKEIWENGHVF